MSQLKNIVKIHYKDVLGSAFVLPTKNKECMFLITAHHVLKQDSNIDFDKLKISNFDDKEVDLNFYNDSYYYDSENDFCVLKISNKSEFLLPTIAVAYQNESFELVGYPKCLYGSTLKQHSLSCKFTEINNNTLFATIMSPIENYTTEEHELIEGFSGGPFIHEKDGILYFFGIENKTVTEDTAYNLVQGVSGEYILKKIYEKYFEESEAPFETIFNLQPSDVHEIYASDESDISNFRNLKNYSKDKISDIDDVIGEAYEIDRSEILEKIKKSDSKFISIIGDAGSGKTALAKKYIIDEEFVLYARAEQFAQEDNITNVWKCDIEKISHILKSKKITVFIDALEFIADRIGRFDSLNQMYEIANRNINIKIITTCRTSDISAFLAIESKYNVSSFEIAPLSQKELDDIMNNFSIINDLKNEKYSQLLKSPFYINLIVRKNFDMSNINDESSFRELVFNEVICFKSECDRHNVSFDDVVSTIKLIVFSRAKDFSLGVHKDDIQNNILLALESKNIIIEKDCCIRLKYDIFEDIVFEREFDKEFVTCRGNYNQFYESIINYGKCIYRRYQIWIANKLHIDDARKRFIYELIFNNRINSEWKKQTIIGIVKSKHCIEFFDEYEEELFEDNILKDFIDVINLYSFSMTINDNTNLVLYPAGIARGKIIDIIKKTGVFQKEDLLESSIIKLCEDYSLSCDTNNEFSESACFIIEKIIDERVNNSGERWYYSAKETVCPLLVILYRLANSCTNWLDNYFEKLIQYFKSGDLNEKRVASDIAEFTMLNTTHLLAEHNMEKLSELATQFWTYNDMSVNFFSDYNEYYKYGLNEHAEEYQNVFRSPFNNLFFINILCADFKFALNWTICFINKGVDTYLQDYQKEELTVQIFFADNKVTRNYYATENFWLMGIQEHKGPVLLSDLIYLLKSFLIKQLEAHQKEDIFIVLANFIKEIIYAKSNNIALLTIIEAIGLHFMNQLPGYALDLASCMELIYLDMERFQLYINNPTKELIEKQIYAIFGISDQLITERYKLDEKCSCSLQEYFFDNYFYFEKQRVKCNAICDYLYDKFPDNIDNSEFSLQIQKMDGRKVAVKDLGDGCIAITPKIEGNAQLVVKETEKTNADNIFVAQMIEKCGLKEGEEINLDCVNQTIDYIIQHSFERINLNRH